MFKKTLVSIAIASLGCSFAGQAMAGAAAASGQQIGIVVQGDNGSWNLDLSALMSFNAATGAFAFDSSKVAAPVSDAQGEWSLALAGSKDVDGVTVLTSDRVRWHSWERVDGTSGATATTDNPWSSVFTFTASGNVDPFMTYGFTAKNNTASTQTYTFTMGEALSPSVAGAYDIYADVSGSIVNGTGSNVTITPALADQDGDGIAELQVLSLSNDGGLTFVNAGVDVGQKDLATGSKAYGLYSQLGSGSGSFNYWAFETQFTLTAGKDVASLAGYAEITPVPEPAMWGMLLGGVGLLGFAARGRKK
ncbi:PEP-CTERM sorting domain-containing protein [Uliginosibacterium sp. H3]|uniref:PEP-CTERM sorting domain-containing protein n=1 Tax=Uliginosibacterium silvisoli TaxID=3114758 RepID=A0ABU6K5D7_9RHOO|nr:PEP-CTERM sorting domain-containing protein [Uliginosibacterium sp. H3]